MALNQDAYLKPNPQQHLQSHNMFQLNLVLADWEEIGRKMAYFTLTGWGGFTLWNSKLEGRGIYFSLRCELRAWETCFPATVQCRWIWSSFISWLGFSYTIICRWGISASRVGSLDHLAPSTIFIVLLLKYCVLLLSPCVHLLNHCRFTRVLVWLISSALLKSHSIYGLLTWWIIEVKWNKLLSNK